MFSFRYEKLELHSSSLYSLTSNPFKTNYILQSDTDSLILIVRENDSMHFFSSTPLKSVLAVIKDNNVSRNVIYFGYNFTH